MKIICCRTGQCLKVLSGHRRTPWVVRFHPSNPRLLASGSLDYEVRCLPSLFCALSLILRLCGAEAPYLFYSVTNLCAISAYEV